MNRFKNWTGMRLFTLMLVVIGISPLLMGAQTENTSGCSNNPPSSDDVQRTQQEKMLQQRNAMLGMPTVTNFRKAKFMKEVIERTDQAIVTYTYNQSETFGCYNFISISTGFPIPYATQYTNPQKVEYVSISAGHTYQVLPQADPDGLFSPASAEGTWSLLKNPEGKEMGPTYSEPKLFTSPFKLPDNLLCDTVITKYIATFAKAMRGDDVVKILSQEKEAAAATKSLSTK